MIILMICEFYNSQLEYQENLLAKYYIKHNHSVTIVTSTVESVFDYYEARYDRRALPRTYYDNGAKIIRLRYSLNILGKIKKFTSISEILKNEKPNLIYVHDMSPNIMEAARYVRANPSCQMILDYHADFSNSAKNWVSLNILHKLIRKRLLLSRAKKHISKIFPVVPASAKFLHEVYDIPYEEMELLPLGTDTDLCAKALKSGSRQIVRKRLAIPDGSFVIFSGGKLEPAKRTELLIEALGMTRDNSIHLIVAGESSGIHKDYRSYLTTLSQGNPKIHFVGWLERDAVYDYMAASDIAVFPASQSIIWQQAIGMGLPLIVGNIGGQSISYLNKHSNIVILEKQDICSERISGLIKAIKDDKYLYDDMKKGALDTAQEYLNWDKLIQKTLGAN